MHFKVDFKPAILNPASAIRWTYECIKAWHKKILCIKKRLKVACLDFTKLL
jgi:hypothetical protein